MSTQMLKVDVIKREKWKITVSLDAKVWDSLVEEYQEQAEFSANKKNLELEAQKSLTSWYGLTI